METIRNSGDMYFELERSGKEYMVEFTYIDEGWGGFYDEDDRDDEQLIRFYVQTKIDGEWVDLEDGSYCTQLNIDTPANLLEIFAEHLANAADNISPKRELEWLTWTTYDELQAIASDQYHSTIEYWVVFPYNKGRFKLVLMEVEMKEYQVLVTMKVGDSSADPSVGDPPKWITKWYDCEYLEAIVLDTADPMQDFQVKIYVPALDYGCTVDNYYLRYKPDGTEVPLIN